MSEMQVLEMCLEFGKAYQKESQGQSMTLASDEK